MIAEVRTLTVAISFANHFELGLTCCLALVLFAQGVWFNTHGLPSGVCVFEIRVLEGYGARWYITNNKANTGGVVSGKSESSSRVSASCVVKSRVEELFEENLEVSFRGFLEPHQKEGHAKKWRH
jgi:hypothetical protein